MCIGVCVGGGGGCERGRFVLNMALQAFFLSGY